MRKTYFHYLIAVVSTYVRWECKFYLTWAGGGGAAAAPLPLKQILKNTDFVDMLISKVLCDLRFNLNQSLNSADE